VFSHARRRFGCCILRLIVASVMAGMCDCAMVLMPFSANAAQKSEVAAIADEPEPQGRRNPDTDTDIDRIRTLPSVTNHASGLDARAPDVGEGSSFLQSSDADPPRGRDGRGDRFHCAYPSNSGEGLSWLNTGTGFPHWVLVHGDASDSAIVEGKVVYSKVATDDSPIDHQTIDENFFISPDPKYAHMLASPGNFNGFAGNSVEKGRIEVEIERAAYPSWALPVAGDWVHVEGAYIFDCGHWSNGYHTEIHPPRLTLTLRGEGYDVSRPPLPSTLPQACVSDDTKLTQLHQEVADLQEELQHASSVADKQELIREIKELVRQVQDQQGVLKGCIDSHGGLAPHPGAAAPGWADMLPEASALPVSVMRADLFGSSDGGGARQQETCFTRLRDPERPEFGLDPSYGCTEPGAPKWYQCLACGDYTVFVPAPPKPSTNARLVVRQLDDRPLPDGMQRVTPWTELRTDPTDATRPGALIHLDLRTRGYREPPNHRYGVGSTILLGWASPVGRPWRHLRVILDRFQVTNPLDGGAPFLGMRNGEWSLSAVVQDQFRFIYSPRQNRAIGGLGVPYIDNVNVGTYPLSESFDVVLLEGQPLRLLVRGVEIDDFPNPNDPIGVVEHIFNDAQNYGVGTTYTEHFQERTSAGADELDGDCICGSITFHIEEILDDFELLRDWSSPAVYVLFGGARFWIPSPSEFGQLGYDWSRLRVAPDGTAAHIPVVPRDSTLLRERSSPAVYVVYSGRRYLIPSQAEFFRHGFSWSNIREVPNGSVGAIPVGGQVPPAKTCANERAQLKGLREALLMTTEQLSSASGAEKRETIQEVRRLNQRIGDLQWLLVPCGG
jgi:hypothetical protein